MRTREEWNMKYATGSCAPADQGEGVDRSKAAGEDGRLILQDREGRKGEAASADPIAAGLKKLLQDVAQEPIPDDFLMLLDQIDARLEQPGGGDPLQEEAGPKGRTAQRDVA